MINKAWDFWASDVQKNTEYLLSMHQLQIVGFTNKKCERTPPKYISSAFSIKPGKSSLQVNLLKIQKYIKLHQTLRFLLEKPRHLPEGASVFPRFRLLSFRLQKLRVDDFGLFGTSPASGFLFSALGGYKLLMVDTK